MAGHTLNEIARLAGVSASTVSRVANNIGMVKPETREKVLEVMSAYGYVPNQVARNLKMCRSNAVGIIVPDIEDPYFANVVAKLEAELSARDYSMILCISNEKAEKERRYLEFMMRNMVDGAVVATVSDVHETHMRYIESGRALVFIDNMPSSAEGFGAIMTDNAGASHMAVEHLFALGHRNIAVIAGRQEESTGAERLFGYKEAMRRHKLPIREGWIRIGDFKANSGYEAMRALLRENPEITAVYVHSSQMTYGACKAVEEAGMALARDISLVGFDIHNSAGMLESNITSVVQQEDQISRMACEALINAITHGKEAACEETIRLEAKLAVRQSTTFVKGG